MKFPHLRMKGRAIAMAYLCVSVLVPSLLGVVVVREGSIREEATLGTSRMLFAQAIASGMSHSAASTGALLSMLAAEDATKDALATGGVAGLEPRFRNAMEAGAFNRIELRDGGGHEVFSVSREGGASTRGTANVSFHRSVRHADAVVGEVAGWLPVDALMDRAPYSLGLGTVVLSTLDGRVLADLEAGDGADTLDVPEATGTTHPRVEAGVGSSGAASSIAFAVPGNLPILVTVTAGASESPWPWRDLLVLDALLLTVGWFVLSYATRAPAPG